MRTTWTKLCARSGACDASFFDDVAELEEVLRTSPFTGWGPNQFGGGARVVLNPANLARMMYNGTFAGDPARLPAAVKAFLDGNRKPLLR